MEIPQQLKIFRLFCMRERVVCLLGPSGCGKSTALRIAAGLERLQKGVVELGDVIVSDREVHLPAEDRNVGLVFQDYALFPHLSVLDNVKFGLRRDRSRITESKAVHALEMVHMEKFLTKYSHMLSGGEQQRVALARALAPQPDVMLLDEPYSDLMPCFVKRYAMRYYTYYVNRVAQH